MSVKQDFRRYNTPVCPPSASVERLFSIAGRSLRGQHEVV